MNGTIKPDANDSKTPARAAHESLERPEGQSELDREAEDSAKRAQNRLKENEGTNPGSQIFTK